MEAAQRVIDAQAARQRAAADAERTVAEALQRRLAEEARQASVRAEAEARAERLVAIEAEARAKAEAEIALAAERQAQELAIQREHAQRARPRGLIALASGLAAMAIALGVLVVVRVGPPLGCVARASRTRWSRRARPSRRCGAARHPRRPCPHRHRAAR